MNKVDMMVLARQQKTLAAGRPCSEQGRKKFLMENIGLFGEQRGKRQRKQSQVRNYQQPEEVFRWSRSGVDKPQ